MPRVFLSPSTNYERRMLEDAFDRFPDWSRDASDPREADLQWGKARDVAWDAVFEGTLCANSFPLKSALTRKAELARTLRRRRERDPDVSAAATAPETHVLSDPEDEDGDEDEETERASSRTSPAPSPRRRRFPSSVADGRWALKASESNRGENVLFVDASSAADRERAERAMARVGGDWVLQKYVDPDGRVLARGGRKFHLRAHVLVVGDARVWVHDDPVALLAETRFDARNTTEDLTAHLTNRCARERNRNKRRDTRADDASNANAPPSIALDRLRLEVTSGAGEGDGMDATETILARARRSIRAQCADLFAAARGKDGGGVGFVPLAGSFELFGVDFLLDENGDPKLLEVNSDPSLAVFGEEEEARDRCATMLHDVLALGLAEVERAATRKSAREASPPAERERDAAASSLSSSLPNRRVGGFELVATLPPKIAGDESGASLRRRVSTLFAMMGGVAGTLAEDRRGGDERGGRLLASVPANAKGARGVAAALRRAGGWDVCATARVPADCDLQWGAHRAVRWERVMDRDPNARRLVASKYYARLGLLRYRGADDATAGPNALAGVARFVVSGSEPRVDVYREMGGAVSAASGESFEAVRSAVGTEIARVVRDAAAAATKSASNRSLGGGGGTGERKRGAFLPFPNCFEVFEARVAAWCVPDTGSWRARVFRVDDAFAESEEASEGEGANEKQSADDDALAEDVARLALEVFFGGEPSGDAWMRVCVSVGCE